MASSPDHIVEALKEYTTCDVSDALCKLHIYDAGFLPGLTMWSPQRQDGSTKIVGPAYTVKYKLHSDPTPKVDSHYIDSIPEGAVVFIQSDPIADNACYGGLMSTRAKASKAVGTVIDGRFRDLQEHRDLDYPIFARDLGTAPPGPFMKVTGINVGLKSRTTDDDIIVINPGDYIIGDVNGVVVLPQQLAEKAIPLMAKQVAADSQMAAAISQGMSFTEASKRFRS